MGRGQRRVLHVLTDSDRRGAQVFALDLVDALSDQFEHSVVALRPGLRPGAQLEVDILGDARHDIRTLSALRRRLRGADVVVAHGSSTLLACALAGLGIRVPLVYRNISDPDYWWTGLRRWRVKWLLRRYDRVVTLWEGGADRVRTLLQLPEAKMVTIGNGVREVDFPPPTEKERAAARRSFDLTPGVCVCVMVSALQPEKHPDTAVHALRHLPADTQLLVVGDGPLRSEVEVLAETLAPGRVRVLGHVEDVRPAYLAADVMVLPSEGEGLPAVLIEAGLCELAAVASTSGGNAEIVLDGVTGRIVPPADPRALADAVLEVWDERRAMGCRARDHVLGHYGLAVIADKWASVLCEVAADRSGVSR